MSCVWCNWRKKLEKHSVRHCVSFSFSVCLCTDSKGWVSFSTFAHNALRMRDQESLIHVSFRWDKLYVPTFLRTDPNGLSLSYTHLCIIDWKSWHDLRFISLNKWIHTCNTYFCLYIHFHQFLCKRFPDKLQMCPVRMLFGFFEKLFPIQVKLLWEFKFGKKFFTCPSFIYFNWICHFRRKSLLIYEKIWIHHYR